MNIKYERASKKLYLVGSLTKLSYSRGLYAMALAELLVLTVTLIHIQKFRFIFHSLTMIYSKIELHVKMQKNHKVVNC